MGMGAATQSWVVGLVIITLSEVNTHSSSRQTKTRTRGTKLPGIRHAGMRRGLTVRPPKATSGVQNIVPGVRRKCRLQQEYLHNRPVLHNIDRVGVHAVAVDGDVMAELCLSVSVLWLMTEKCQGFY